MSKDSQMELLIGKLCSIPELHITRINNAVQDYLNNTRGMYGRNLVQLQNIKKKKVECITKAVNSLLHPQTRRKLQGIYQQLLNDSNIIYDDMPLDQLLNYNYDLINNFYKIKNTKTFDVNNRDERQTVAFLLGLYNDSNYLH